MPNLKDGAFWTSLLTVFVTLGVISLSDAELTGLSDNIVQAITYIGLVVAGIAAALGINNKGKDD